MLDSSCGSVGSNDNHGGLWGLLEGWDSVNIAYHDTTASSSISRHQMWSTRVGSEAERCKWILREMTGTCKIRGTAGGLCGSVPEQRRGHSVVRAFLEEAEMGTEAEQP
jgi:hypothetical protein